MGIVRKSNKGNALKIYIVFSLVGIVLGVTQWIGTSISTKGMTGVMNLTGKRLADEDAIQLDWTAVDQTEPYTYQVYSKKPTLTEFQSISAVDLEQEVRVLNIHPDAGNYVTYTTWDGTTRTIKQSGSAEKWMEEPNDKHPKGYGMGLIDVQPLTVSSFNENPNSYLKDADGNWAYDVIFLGTWDANDRKNLNAEATKTVEEFISSGRGFLAGHDTIGYLETSVHLNTLAPLLNMKPTGGINQGYTEVEIKKRGLLTQYPWNIGGIGDKLTIPMTHTLGQLAYGDVWMMFTDNSWSTVKDRLDDPVQNHYLTTWNNTAMIQTGHSNGLATNDEQMILANTMFYLSQLTTDTNLKDNSAMDATAPGFTNKTTSVVREDSKIKVDFPDAQENESLFEYYVEATGVNTGKTQRSETIKVSNASGLAGYSYVSDNNPTTLPDNKVDTTESQLEIAEDNAQPKYVHVVAVDNKGNFSEPIHITLDNTKPSIEITKSPEGWTKGTVSLKVNARDIESGVLTITLPNGLTVNGGTTEYTVTSNGDYTFKVTDKAGNIQEVNYKVSNIDKTLPNHGKVWVDGVTNDSFYVYIDGVTDLGSGIKEVRFPTWTDKGGQDDLNMQWQVSMATVGEDMGNGVWRYKVERSEHKGEFSHYTTHPYVYDNAGNVRATFIYYEMKDIVPPEIIINATQTSLTKGDVDLTVKALDEHTGVKSLTLPDGTVVNKNVGKGVETSHTYRVIKNGNYTFKAVDEYGTESTKTFTVSNIDKTAPTITIEGNPTNWTGDDVITLNIKAKDDLSGVKSITLPDGKVVNDKDVAYEIKQNGVYKFTVVDNLGNTHEETVKVEYMMVPYTFYMYDSKGKPIQGAGYDLHRDGTKYADALSDKTGLVDFGKVPTTGKYTIKQTKAPDGYVVNPDEKEVDVGDTTEPEEYISYPRGKELPGTGTEDMLVYVSVIGTILTGLTIIKVRKLKLIK